LHRPLDPLLLVGRRGGEDRVDDVELDQRGRNLGVQLLEVCRDPAQCRRHGVGAALEREGVVRVGGRAPRRDQHLDRVLERRVDRWQRREAIVLAGQRRAHDHLATEEQVVGQHLVVTGHDPRHDDVLDRDRPHDVVELGEDVVLAVPEGDLQAVAGLEVVQVRDLLADQHLVAGLDGPSVGDGRPVHPGPAAVR
jgi:hypothetical protein